MVSFYFLERRLEGLAELEIKHGRLEKEWGKMMIPLTFEVRDAGVVEEVRRVAEFKKRVK